MLRTVSLCLLLWPGGVAAGGDAALFVDFDGRGEQLAARLAHDEHLTIIDGAGVNGSAGLRAEYVGGPKGSARMVLRAKLDEPDEAYTLCYDVRFAEDFQFVRGGKLHGLGPASPITGGRPMQPGGWSARVMFEDEGRLRSYVYHQDKEGKYGDGVGSGKVMFERGVWHAVSLSVKLNSAPDKADGLVRIFVDGKPVVVHGGLRFRARAGQDTLIGRFLFSTFHGGHDPSWAPKDASGRYTTVRARFDNIGIYKGQRVRPKAGGAAEKAGR